MTEAFLLLRYGRCLTAEYVVGQSPVADHQANHQPYSWLEHVGFTETQRPKSPEAWGDLKHWFGDCAFPLQKQRKRTARKHIDHLVAFPAAVVEEHC